MPQRLLDRVKVAAARVNQRCRDVPQIPKIDRREIRAGADAAERLRDSLGVQPRAVLAREHLARVLPRLAPLQALPILPGSVRTQHGHRRRVEPDRGRAAVRLGRRLVWRPAVRHDLRGHREFPAVEVHLSPALADRLSAAQPSEPHQVKQRGQPFLVGLGLVEEHAELLRRPHHDRTRLLAALAPPTYTFLGPQQRLRTLARLQLDIRSRIEGDQSAGDRSVQCGPQRATDRLPGGWPIRLPVRLHLGELCPLLGEPPALRHLWRTLLSRPAPRLLLATLGILGLDHLVVVGDRVEHLRQMIHVQSVQPDVSDAGLQVHADVGLVAVVRRRPGLLLCHPRVEPLAHSHTAGERLTTVQLAARLFEVGQRGPILGHLLQQFSDAGTALVVVLLGERKQRADFVEVALCVRRGCVAASAEVAAGAVLAGREFLPKCPEAVTLLFELRARLPVLLAGLRVTAGAPAEGRALHQCAPVPPLGGGSSPMRP
nr:hypothetical protein [Streptomyces achromogenes]